MYKVDQLMIQPEVPEEIQKLANDLVGYVLRKSDRKVVDTAVIRRKALPVWFEERRSKFTGDDYVFCISATSTVGIVLGMLTTEVEKKPDGGEPPEDPKGGKKSNYNYHVN